MDAFVLCLNMYLQKKKVYCYDKAVQLFICGLHLLQNSFKGKQIISLFSSTKKYQLACQTNESYKNEQSNTVHFLP